MYRRIKRCPSETKSRVKAKHTRRGEGKTATFVIRMSLALSLLVGCNKQDVDVTGFYGGTVHVTHKGQVRKLPLEVSLHTAGGLGGELVIAYQLTYQVTSVTVHRNEIDLTASLNVGFPPPGGLEQLLMGDVEFVGKLDQERLTGHLIFGESGRGEVSTERLSPEEIPGWEDLKRARSPAAATLCMLNLKALYFAAFEFSLTSNFFPGKSGAPAHESLNLILRSSAGKKLKPNTFVCPAGEAVPAEPGADGAFTLTSDNLSYTWVSKRIRKTGRALPLASDKYVHGFEDEQGKHKGHDGYIHIVYTDGSVRRIDVRSDRHRLNEDLLPPGLTR